MSSTVINRERVESLKETLQERYREVPVEQEGVTVPTEDFESHFETARGDTDGGYDGGGYAWVVRDPTEAAELSETMVDGEDDRRRVLMHYPRGGDAWGLPGGGREGDERFEDAAVREVREETGVECEITNLWLLRHLVWSSEDPDDDRETHSIHVFFDARYTGGSISIQAGESNGAAWFAELPERMMPANEFRAKTWTPETE